MGGQVIEDHHVPGTQYRHQHLLHARTETLAALTAPGSTRRARTQSRPNVAITGTDSHDAGAEASTRSPCGGSAVGGRPRRRDPGLVHEDQPAGFDRFDYSAEGAALLANLGGVRSAACLDFFLRG